jgi:hypothetical protein
MQLFQTSITQQPVKDDANLLWLDGNRVFNVPVISRKELCRMLAKREPAFESLERAINDRPLCLENLANCRRTPIGVDRSIGLNGLRVCFPTGS